MFYMWGDHHRGTYFKAGIGVGLGIAKFDGDIILTDSVSQDRISVSNGTSELKLASSALLEARWNNWGLLLTAAGPNLEKNGIEVQVADTALSFGYRFVF